jgi:hypothetical protein
MELECVDGRLFQMEAQHPALFCSAAGGNAVLPSDLGLEIVAGNWN